MNDQTAPASRGGLLYALVAYGTWGVVPLYFNKIIDLAEHGITPADVLANRIAWSVPFLLLLLLITRRWSLVGACIRNRLLLWTLSATTVLIAVNWYLFIYGVATDQVVQTSVGYFINPLVNVVLGMIFFHERPRRLQWMAIALAMIGVSGMAVAMGELPWIALSLALSFGFYGLLRKMAPVDGLVGLVVEISLLAPFAAGFLIWRAMVDGVGFGTFGPACDALIMASGVVTAVPLMCFAQAARRLRLTTMGFMQYLSPSLQFLCGAVILHEPLKPVQLVCFGWIWCGLAVFSVDSLLWMRARAGKA